MSKRLFESSINSDKGIQRPRKASARRTAAKHCSVRVPRKSCEDQFRLVEPQINAEGVHLWPFNESFPIDVRFLTSDGRHNVRMNRHDYFEILYLCAGTAQYHIQDRLLPMHEGDLAVVGSTVYHRLECRGDSLPTMAALFFEPDMIRSDGGSENAEYLTPFLLQDSQFPHILPAKGGIPSQIFDLMQRIRAELPAMSTRSRLAVKTYLKMILILLVNQYSSYAGTVEIFRRQQRALDRLRPLFDHLSQHFGEPIQVKDAARTCGMSESHFMSFFKRTTGQSFMAYLNHCRIERAEALLVTTEKSMSEVSQEMGFCDQSYFGTVFRRLVGMTPAAYRRRFRTGEELPFKLVDHAIPALAPVAFQSALPSRSPTSPQNNRQIVAKKPSRPWPHRSLSMRLKDKVAIVTGAGTGIGRAIAQRFGQEGAKVVIAEIDAATGRSSAEVLACEGGDAIFLRTDVSNEDQVRAMVEAALARFGRIDVLCNNAGILLFHEEARAHELSNETWDRTLAVNLRGYWLTSKYVIPSMLKQGGGSIIQVASPTGMFAFARLTAYSTSKGGVIALTRAMAADYAKDRIRVNAIVPGTIDTPMNAPLFSDSEAREHSKARNLLGRLGTPQDLAGIALFLASDDSAYCAGGLFTVDGGQTAM